MLRTTLIVRTIVMVRVSLASEYDSGFYVPVHCTGSHTCMVHVLLLVELVQYEVSLEKFYLS